MQERVRGIAAEVLREPDGREGSVAITIRASYPSHVGLGSGSQLGLAVAGLSPNSTAVTSGEGTCKAGRPRAARAASARSLEYGGFIVDGGHPFGAGSEKTDFRPSAASRGVTPPP